MGGEIFYAILPLSICRSNPSIHPFSQIHCFWSALSLWLQCGHPSALTFHSLNSAPLMMRHPILLSSLRPVEIEHLKWIKLFLKNYHNKITIHWDEHRRRHNWILFWKRLRLADNNLKISRINWCQNGRGEGDLRCWLVPAFGLAFGNSWPIHILLLEHCPLSFRPFLAFANWNLSNVF